MASLTKLQRAIEKRSLINGMFEDINDSLKAELVIRGLNPEVARNDVTIKTEVVDGKHTVIMSIKRDHSVEAPFRELSYPLKRETGKHGTFSANVLSPYSNEVSIDAFSKADLLAGLNAAISDPEFRIDAAQGKAQGADR
jgi:hypothetical protein